MKYLKTYELNKQELRDEKLSFATMFLEDKVPLTEEDGFIKNCEYGNDEKPILISFYFQFWADEEAYDKFYKFLDEYKLKIYDEHTVNGISANSKYEIRVKLSEYQINKFASFYYDIEKYNL